nr:contractile injection system tape measure protein [Kistimonas asteriae]
MDHSFDDAQYRDWDTRGIEEKPFIETFNQPVLSETFVELQSVEFPGVDPVLNPPTFSSAFQKVLSLAASTAADQLLAQAIEGLLHSQDVADAYKTGIKAWLQSYGAATGFLRRQSIRQLKQALKNEGVGAFTRPWSLVGIEKADKALSETHAPLIQDTRSASGKRPESVVTELLTDPHLPLALARSLKQWRDNGQTIPVENRNRWLRALLKQLRAWQQLPKGIDTACLSIRSQLLHELDDAIAITLPAVWRSAGQRCHQRLSSADDRLSLAVALEQLLVLLDFIGVEHPAMSHWLRPRRKRWKRWVSQLDPATCATGNPLFPAPVNVAFRQQEQAARSLVYGQEQLSRLKASLQQGDLVPMCREYLQVKVSHPEAFRESLATQLASGALPSRDELNARIQHFQEALNNQAQSLEEDMLRFRQVVSSGLAGADPQVSAAVLEPIVNRDVRELLGGVLASRSEQKTGCLPEPARASIQSLLHELEQTVQKPTSSIRQVSSLDDGLTEDAGLAVLWPHLPTLFGKLQLLTQSGTAFVNEAAQLRGMALLVAAAGIEYGEDKTPQCMTAALLTGLPAETSSDALPVVTEQETQAIENMLLAVIQQWPVLKSMPPAGLRTMFLQRHGLWDRCDSGWRLTVADQAQDVLLQGLPWPISIIRLPWLNDLLSIHWKKGEGFSLSAVTSAH